MNKFSLAAIFLLAAVSLSAESFTYQTISAPGATSTSPVGIDDQGQIVGNYTNSTGTYGFIDTGGTFTPLPGVTVINTSGNGTLLVKTSNGFATYANGKYSPLSIPGYQFCGPGVYCPLAPVIPAAINNSGQLLGTATFYNEIFVQFLVNGNQLTFLSKDYSFEPIIAKGLNDQAEAVGVQVLLGSFAPGSPSFGVIYNPSTGTWTDVQGPYDHAGFSAVNNLGEIAGYFQDTYGNPGSDAIVYSGGIFTYLAVPVPNTSLVEATGINDLGEVVGTTDACTFYACASNPQGFLAIPEANTAVPEPFTGMLSILGLALLWFWIGKRRDQHLPTLLPEYEAEAKGK